MPGPGWEPSDTAHQSVDTEHSEPTAVDDNLMSRFIPVLMSSKKMYRAHHQDRALSGGFVAEFLRRRLASKPSRREIEERSEIFARSSKDSTQSR
jgi:hypothetical protein